MARCVLDVIDAINRDRPTYELVGVVADSAPDLQKLVSRGVEYLGSTAQLERLSASLGYVIGIGASQVRQTLDARFRARPSPVLVHPNAHLGFGVELGPGTVICSHVSIESNVRIGRHVHVNQNSTVGHDSELADYVTVSPLVAISGNVVCGQAAFLGTNCAIRERTRIGAGATVGMGSAVLSDVDAGATVLGVPARHVPQRVDSAY